MNYGLRRLSRNYQQQKSKKWKQGESTEKTPAKLSVENGMIERVPYPYTDETLESSGSCLYLYRKPIGINLLCLAFLFIYSVVGGLVFLHFEEPYSQKLKQIEFEQRHQCVQNFFRARRVENSNSGYAENLNDTGFDITLDMLEEVVESNQQGISGLTEKITSRCVIEHQYDERLEWNLKNAVLFGFGILTTLGYGKIEPQTTNGRLFTVIYGFIGVPFTVIIFTNFGRYLQNLERFIRIKYFRRLKNYFNTRKRNEDRKQSQILSPITVIQPSDVIISIVI